VGEGEEEMVGCKEMEKMGDRGSAAAPPRAGGSEGRLELERRGGLQSIGCEINGPQPKLSSKLSAPAKECQKSTVSLRYAPPRTPNPNGTEHERGGKRNLTSFQKIGYHSLRQLTSKELFVCIS
jgi:hypothetical protein